MESPGACFRARDLVRLPAPQEMSQEALASQSKIASLSPLLAIKDAPSKAMQ